MNREVDYTPERPYNRMATLNLDESADEHRVGVSMEAKVWTVSPCKGVKCFGPGIKRSGGTAEGTLPPSTRAVLLRFTLRTGSSDGSIDTT